MIKTDNYREGLPLYVIYPGEHFFTDQRCYFNTVSGSCLVICLYDPDLKIGGMGHFIVPGTLGTEGIYADEIAEHGIYNIELLVANFVKRGVDRRSLKAKIFGAGYVAGGAVSGVVNSNIRFIHEYLQREAIELMAEDLGGNFRRYLLFKPHTGEAFRKTLINNDSNSEFVKLEKEYIDSAFRNKEIKTNYLLFE